MYTTTYVAIILLHSSVYFRIVIFFGKQANLEDEIFEFKIYFFMCLSTSEDHQNIFGGKISNTSSSEINTASQISYLFTVNTFMNNMLHL